MLAKLDRQLLALGALAVLMNGGTLLLFGVRYAPDTQTYLSGADDLLAGRPLGARASSYMGYVALLALCSRTGLGTAGLIALQIGFSFMAMLALLRLGTALPGRHTGVIAATLMALNPEIARWNTYVLTDSLYISLVVLATLTMHTAAERGRTHYAATVLAFVGAGLVRPNGWALWPVAGVYWIARAVSRPWARALAVTGVLATSVVAGLTLSGNAIQGREPDIMLQRGEVIWGYPAAQVAMPVEPVPERHGWAPTIRYAVHHPLATAGLSGRRVAMELAHARPDFSRTHNVATLVLVPFYTLVVAGAWAARRRPLTPLLLAVVGTHLLIVAVSYADWDGRFLLYVLPLLGLLAAVGLEVSLPRLVPGLRG